MASAAMAWASSIRIAASTDFRERRHDNVVATFGTGSYNTV
jgi:hypothetical protein